MYINITFSGWLVTQSNSHGTSCQVWLLVTVGVTVIVRFPSQIGVDDAIVVAVVTLCSWGDASPIIYNGWRRLMAPVSLVTSWVVACPTPGDRVDFSAECMSPTGRGRGIRGISRFRLSRGGVHVGNGVVACVATGFPPGAVTVSPLGCWYCTLSCGWFFTCSLLVSVRNAG